MAEMTKPQTTAPATPLTLAEYIEAFRDQPIEVVDGEIIVMSPPEVRHVRIARDLFLALHKFASERQLGEVWPDGTAYLLQADDRTDWVRGARIPDVSFVARERMKAHLDEHGEEGPLRLAPDLAVGIVSPNDKYTDVNQKVTDYLRFGVRLVWVIDPAARTVRAHTPDDSDGKTIGAEETLSGEPMLAGWSLPIKQLIDGPPEAEPAE
jgi:Uma2 family endonuclease